MYECRHMYTCPHVCLFANASVSTVREAVYNVHLCVSARRCVHGCVRLQLCCGMLCGIHVRKCSSVRACVNHLRMRFDAKGKRTATALR